MANHADPNARANEILQPLLIEQELTKQQLQSASHRLARFVYFASISLLSIYAIHLLILAAQGKSIISVAYIVLPALGMSIAKSRKRYIQSKASLAAARSQAAT